MIEIKKGFHVNTLKEHKQEHEKDLLKDIAMLQNIRNYTIDEDIQNLSIKIENKIMNNEYLSSNDIEIFYKLSYLNYLKNFFPLNYDTIDLIIDEYDFLIN